jgi:hypothetical protein
VHLPDHAIVGPAIVKIHDDGARQRSAPSSRVASDVKLEFHIALSEPAEGEKVNGRISESGWCPIQIENSMLGSFRCGGGLDLVRVRKDFGMTP